MKKIKIKYKTCKKCGRAVHDDARADYGFIYHRICFVAIYGLEFDD